jgi:GNAT superfamily N-acetyltransferase
LAEITIRFLELTRDTFAPKRSDRAGVVFAKVDPPMPALNRFLYTAIGGRWYWLDRRSWTLAQWSQLLARDGQIETWVLSLDGVPAGYAELERRDGNNVEISYLGLMDAFIGKGLGAHLVTSAVERALAMGANTVLLNTCNLDHPQALANYVARGFREVRVENKPKEIPGAPPGPWEGAHEVNAARELLRHTIAVVAYRGAKALRGAPASFADFRPGPTSRTPLQILAHICDLYDWSITLAYADPKWNDSTPGSWPSESDRFFAALKTLDDHIASGAPIYCGAERLFAGPIADSIQHIGQLTMLRRLAGAPIRGESYAVADIETGRVGADQAAPRREFDR